MSFINWESGQVSNWIQEIFYTGTVDLGLQQLITIPTRGRNVLDLLFTNDPSIVVDSFVTDAFLGSDHLAIRFTLFFSCETFSCASAHQIMDWYNADWGRMFDFFSFCDWSSVLKLGIDANLAWTSFCLCVLNAAKQFLPTKSTSVYSQKHHGNSKQLRLLANRKLIESGIN